ncbi:hypothetical protein EOS93_20165 [Rhizobium sp. RMa-01]|uniref:hypothetical protein n=1 Tax=unclassified Rhizobium TaxID=2613769 RepID=UPI0008DA40D3|nr:MULTISPECIES: hypothetical protein [unclassified Rhizobium]OHV18439.1 hypothetical protein BBJ66_19505 [Rhizobium sp. RSm-3]RVU09174.1 hypothetical protein EOS93_20165 [Rhizobium sp. RMa-01]
MTGATYQHSESVVQAAMWLADQSSAPQLVIPQIHERLGLSALEACEAAALSNKHRTSRRTHE